MDIQLVHRYGSKKENAAGVNYNPYVNERPFLASSLMSVAIAELFGTAMNGRSKERQTLADTPISLEAEISILPCKEGAEFIKNLFEPLGYEVIVNAIDLDTKFPEWGVSPYYHLRIKGVKKISELLRHLYVLIPVCDNFKHYWIDFTEQEKLIRLGEGWLPGHPLVAEITRRSMKHIKSLSQQALEQLLMGEAELAPKTNGVQGDKISLSLNQQRMQAVTEELVSQNVKSVLDCGCGEGKFIEMLLSNKHAFQQIKGMDVSIKDLEQAASRIGEKRGISLIHGSLNYLDARTKDFEACVLMEVIEHFDPMRLPEVEKNIFSFIQAPLVIVTTPNREFNSNFVKKGFRHTDHRFEWNRAEFQQWCETISQKFRYQFKIKYIGALHPELGAPTQMGVFTR
jgi:3' terminal RNA ribose 2'-O-methyltransferase Hen1